MGKPSPENLTYFYSMFALYKSMFTLCKWENGGKLGDALLVSGASTRSWARLGFC